MSSSRRRKVLCLEFRRIAGLATRSAAEHFLQHVLETVTATTTTTPTSATAAAAASRAPKAFRSPRETFKAALLPAEATSTGMCAEAFKPLELRLAFRVDFAPVELLALLVVSQNLVGGVELGKARGRFRIAFVSVRMQLLGKTAVCALDCRSVSRLLHPQNLIGVGHSRHSICRRIPRPRSNVGANCRRCNAFRPA